MFVRCEVFEHHISMSHHQHHHHRRRRLRAPELSVWVVGLQLNRYKPTTSGQIACPGTSHQDLCSSSTSPTSPAFNQCRPRAFARPIERRELIGTMSCARRAMLLLSVMLIICGHVSQCLQPNKPSIGSTNNMFSSTAKKLNQTIVQGEYCFPRPRPPLGPTITVIIVVSFHSISSQRF